MNTLGDDQGRPVSVVLRIQIGSAVCQKLDNGIRAFPPRGAVQRRVAILVGRADVGAELRSQCDGPQRVTLHRPGDARFVADARRHHQRCRAVTSGNQRIGTVSEQLAHDGDMIRPRRDQKRRPARNVTQVALHTDTKPRGPSSPSIRIRIMGEEQFHDS